MDKPVKWTWLSVIALLAWTPTGLTQTLSDVQCGGLLTSSYGVLKSPGYPNNYPINVNCHWTISATPGQVVDLRFYRVDVEGSNSSCNDFVRVYDGETSESSPLVTLCGVKNQSEVSNLRVRSTGNKLHVYFSSDYDGVRQGFIAAYTLQACSPFTYGRDSCNQQCTCVRSNSIGCDSITGNCICKEGWTSPTCNLAQCRLNNTCTHSCYVSSTTPWVERCYCPYWMRTISNSSGIFCENKYECNSVINETSGYLTSPGYPSGYTNNHYCTWRIKASANNVIYINFFEVDLENDTTCSKDYVDIYDDSVSGSRLMGRFCGNSIPRSYQSSSNNLRVVFRTDSWGTGKGFVASFYSYMSYSSCIPTVLNGNASYISSPNYPNNYTDNTYVCWIIYGSRVSLRFDAFDLENSTNCAADSVQVYDGPTATSQSLGNFCGRTIPTVRESKSGQLLIVFKTNGAITGRGFSAFYTKTASCGGKLTASSGTIVSPGYPNGYGNSLVCAWTIEGSYNQLITLRVSDLNLETVENCLYDYLDVYNGASISAQRILHDCNRTSQFTWTSTTNSLYILFKSDDSVAGRGFYATYETTYYCNPWTYGYGCSLTCPCVRSNTASCKNQTGYCACLSGWTGSDCSQRIDPCLSNPCPANSTCLSQGSGYTCLTGVYSTCNTTITSTNGYITSPNYPRNYLDNTVCTWTISTPANTIISLSILDLELEENSKCTYDSLEVYDGASTGRLIGKYCGANAQNFIQSTTNSMRLTFKTDSSVVRKGFLASFAAHNCSSFTYGPGCARGCSCVQSNTDNCDRMSGVCVCKAGWTGATCAEDVNECLVQSSSSVCPVNSQCVNTNGSYVCNCKPGYNRTVSNQCQAINNCIRNSALCSHSCYINSIGKEECVCPDNLSLGADKFNCIVPFYPNGVSANDTLLSHLNKTVNGVYFGKVSFSDWTPYGNNLWKEAYVLGNGVISFSTNVLSTEPNFTLAYTQNKAIIAPFWSKMDSTKGSVFYNLYEKCDEATFRAPGTASASAAATKSSVMERAARDLKAFFNLTDIVVNRVLVTTWLDVQPDSALVNHSLR